MHDFVGKHGFVYQLTEQEFCYLGQDFKLCVLAEPDKVIDEMFVHLEQIGAPHLLLDYCPYFGCLWPAALALAQALTETSLNGLQVLELGCGLGLPSFVGSLNGGLMTLSDAHPDVSRLLNFNQSLNPHLQPLRFLPIDWRRAVYTGHYDWLIGSDILYEKTHALELKAFVHAHQRSLKQIIITDPGRPYAPEVVAALKSLGFKADISLKTVIHDAKEHQIRVMRFAKT